MLDYFCIFTKGGTLLWALSFVGSLKGDPINALIRACLLEERAAQSSFDYLIPSGGAYALKWSLNNVRAWGLPVGSVGTAGSACCCALGGCWAEQRTSDGRWMQVLQCVSSLSRSPTPLSLQAGPGPGVCGGLPEGPQAPVRG